MAVATPADYANPHPMAQPGPRSVIVGYHGGGSVGRDVCQRLAELGTARQPWEAEWRDCADFCLPTASRGMRFAGVGGSMDRLTQGPATKDASRRRFDSTAIWAVDRLAAGMESLVAPSDEKWQEQGPTDPLSAEPSDEERQWYERLRNYQFAARYSPMSGFGNSNQKFIRSNIVFGTGVIFTEEGFGKGSMGQRALPFFYQHIPLWQAFIALNAQDVPDTLYRRFSWTARQLVQKFGSDAVSARVRAAAEDHRKMDTPFDIIHAVQPREEAGLRGDGSVRNSAFASFYVEVENHHLIRPSGYFDFPYAVGYWTQADSSGYGESPVMAVLDDVRGLNLSRKAALRSMQQFTDPPIAVAHDGVMNRPNLNPRAVNFGAIDANGRLKIQPIITGQSPSVVQAIIEDQRNDVKEGLYNNLFQILIQNPQMTAHEAMLRAAEKGDLLGPTGVKIQQAYSMVSDREVGILERKGAFYPESPLAPPESLAGKSFGARSTSPLDRLRQAKEGTGIMATYQVAGQIAAVRGDPSVLDNLDDDEALKVLSRINGTPARIMRTGDRVEQLREQRMQELQQQKAMEMAQQGAAAAKDGAAAAVDGTSALAGLLGGPGASAAGAAPVPLPALAPPGAPA